MRQPIVRVAFRSELVAACDDYRGDLRRRASTPTAASTSPRASMLGMTPTTFRAGGKGTSIRFAIGECWLGAILVAASEKGVCAILLGDDPERACSRPSGSISERRADRRRCGNSSGWSRALSASSRRRRSGSICRSTSAARPFNSASGKRSATFPLVDRQLRRNRRADWPAEIRAAVAQACAANPLAVAIPCHRVVRTDGSLVGLSLGRRAKECVARPRTRLQIKFSFAIIAGSACNQARRSYRPVFQHVRMRDFLVDCQPWHSLRPPAACDDPYKGFGDELVSQGNLPLLTTPAESSLARASRCVAVAAAIYALLGGAVTLAGWALDIQRLTDWNNEGISMFPNTAICAVLGGIALLLLPGSNQWVASVRCGPLPGTPYGADWWADAAGTCIRIQLWH